MGDGIEKHNNKHAAAKKPQIVHHFYQGVNSHIKYRPYTREDLLSVNFIYYNRHSIKVFSPPFCRVTGISFIIAL